MEWVNQGSNNCSHRDSKLNHPSLESPKPVVSAESLNYAIEEQIEYPPSKTNPQREESDHWFGEQHPRRSHKGNLQKAPDAGTVKLHFRIYRSPSLFADLPCAFCEDHVWSRFVEDKPEDRNQTRIIDDLDIKNPRSQGLAEPFL